MDCIFFKKTIFDNKLFVFFCNTYNCKWTSFSTAYGTSPFVLETSASSNRRPMKRLMLKTVFFGFVTAWRLASCPTTRSPPFTNPTTDGTVRPPSAELMTVGSPPTIAATTLFVVPRSIPIIFPICLSMKYWLSNWL